MQASGDRAMMPLHFAFIPSFMQEEQPFSFGVLIAYLLPGFTVLWGLSYVSPTIGSWLGTPPAESPTVGGFLYVTLFSVLAGLTASTLRWLLLDSLHHATGIKSPRWDFSQIQANATAFDMLIEIHYRYYQFYGNMLVAIAFFCMARRVVLGFWTAPISGPDVALLPLILLFFLGSRDTLRKYYDRVSATLCSARSRETRNVRPPATRVSQSLPV